MKPELGELGYSHLRAEEITPTSLTDCCLNNLHVY